MNVLLDVVRMGRAGAYLGIQDCLRAEIEKERVGPPIDVHISGPRSQEGLLQQQEADNKAAYSSPVNPEFKKEALVSKRKVSSPSPAAVPTDCSPTAAFASRSRVRPASSFAWWIA